MNKQVMNEEIEKQLNKFLSNYFEIDNTIYKPDILEEWFKKTNYPGIYYRLGLLYEYGLVKEKAYRQENYYFIEAAKMNYVPAMVHLGEIYLKYSNIEMHKAYEYLEKAANQFNDSKAKYLLGLYYLQYGLYEPSNISLEYGIKFLKEADKLGCEKAKECLNLLKNLSI